MQSKIGRFGASDRSPGRIFEEDSLQSVWAIFLEAGFRSFHTGLRHDQIFTCDAFFAA